MKAISKKIDQFHIAYCSGIPRPNWNKHFVFHKFMEHSFNDKRVGFKKKIARAPFYVKRLFHANLLITENLKNLDVDLTYVLSSYWQQRLALTYANKNKVPCVARVRGHFHTELNLKHPFFPRMFYLTSVRKNLKKMKLVIPITNRIKNDLIYLGVDRRKITFPVGLGVDCKKFKPKPKETRKFTVGFVGRLSEEKGVRMLIETAKQCKNIQFNVCGRKQTPLVFPKNIKYFGRIPHSEMPEFYRNVNLIFMPSLTEGFPNVILESYACGRPVIVSKYAIPNEIKLYGFKANLKDLPQKIKFSPHYGLGLLGEYARKYVKKYFTWKIFGEKIHSCFKLLT